MKPAITSTALLSLIISVAVAAANMSVAQIRQKLIGYWKFPKALCYIAADGKMYVGEKKRAQILPEYTAAEAKKHIGETVRVTDKVGCALANRHGGYNMGLGDCDAQTPFWVVTHGDISGPKLDLSTLKGLVITVTGKIDNESGVPRIFVKSTSQIVPHPH